MRSAGLAVVLAGLAAALSPSPTAHHGPRLRASLAFANPLEKLMTDVGKSMEETRAKLEATRINLMDRFGLSPAEQDGAKKAPRAQSQAKPSAVASEDMRNNAGGSDIWFDRGRQVLHCNGHALERDAVVMIIKEGRPVEDRWTITAMNAVEVTLQSGGTKHKVTLAMLRNGRCVLRPMS